MNPFIIPEIVNTAKEFNGRLFPLKRAEKLQYEFAKMFSSHLGCLRGGTYFESEVLVVVGKSGSGKTKEITNLISNFNASSSMLPSGQPARMVSCELDRKAGWKGLGTKTLHSMGYPILDRARLTQSEIWGRVAEQGELQGVVGINYDEMQHILAGKSDLALEEVLDSFKTILKSKNWPFLLILSGVPELTDYLQSFEQLFRKVTYVSFDDIDYDSEATIIHEMVGSYALEAGLKVASDLNTNDFIHRLATAGAFRWGLVCEIAIKSVSYAIMAHADTLTREHFVQVWASKTQMNAMATPFNLDAYSTPSSTAKRVSN